MNLAVETSLVSRLRKGAIAFTATAVFCTLPVMAQSAAGGMQSSGGATQQTGQGAAGQGMGAQQAGPQQMGAMQGQGTQSNANKPKMRDKAFVKKAMESSNAEIQLGQLAQQKASADDVKQFGSQLVTDHTKLNDQMKPVAQQIGLTPPDGVPGKDKKLMNKLQAQSGNQFDSMFIEAMIKDHKEDIKQFKAEAAKGQDETVKNAASQGLPVLQQHLDTAEKLAATHNLPENGKVSKVKSNTGQ